MLNTLFFADLRTETGVYSDDLGKLPAGYYEIIWDGEYGGIGGVLPSGIYHCTIKTDNAVQVKKMCFVR
jgi:hypothetical protein